MKIEPHSSFAACVNSPVGRFDPRWKLAGLLLAAVVAALLRSVPGVAAALIAALALATLSRLPPRWYLGRLAPVLLFLALFVLPLPFLLSEGGRILEVGPISLSQHGLNTALLIIGKAVVIVTFMLVLFATAPLDATLKAAHSLRVPGLIVQMTVLTLRYIAVLSSELARIRVALRVRGYRNRMSRHCYRTTGHVAGTLLVRGAERAERVGHAMRCRGFDGRFRSLAEFHTTPADVAAFFLIASSAAGLLLWDRLAS